MHPSMEKEPRKNTNGHELMYKGIQVAEYVTSLINSRK